MTNSILLMNYGLNQPMGVYRQMWMVEEGTIVVSAVSVDDEFWGYVCDVAGIDRDKVVIVDIGRELTDEVLTSPELLGRLAPLVAGATDWELVPAAFTQGVAGLAELLGLTVDTGLRFAAQRGCELLNRKSHFRRLAAGAKVSVPAGCVVTTERELANGIDRHLPETGTVIVKRDNDLGGRGNRALTKDPVPLPGVRETIAIDGNVSDVAARLWMELTEGTDEVLVVESYHAAARVFYLEYLIDAEGFPRFLDSGLKREVLGGPGAASMVWVGLELPADLGPSTAARALTEAARIVGTAADLGYRGHINVDGIVTTDGRMFFNEVNARWGGSTALHHVGEKLFGANYADDHVVSGLRVVRPAPLAETVGLLRDNGLHFSAESGEGALVLGYDRTFGRATECVLIGPSTSRVREIEDRVCEVVGTVSDPALVDWPRKETK